MGVGGGALPLQHCICTRTSIYLDTDKHICTHVDKCLIPALASMILVLPLMTRLDELHGLLDYLSIEQFFTYSARWV